MLWALSDVSLVLLKKSDLFKTVIPSKIFESMAMKKPLILGVEGEVKSMIKAGCSGLTIEPENAQQLAEAVVRLADDSTLSQELGLNGQKYVTEFYDRKNLASDYEQLMLKIQ